MNLYIASGLDNAPSVRALRDLLQTWGHTITYDWTVHGSVQHEGLARIQAVALNELHGVYQADALVVLLPGGRGTHTEMGAALALHKPVYLLGGPEDRAPGGRTCAFYHHPLVTFGFSREMTLDQSWEHLWMWLATLRWTAGGPAPLDDIEVETTQSRRCGGCHMEITVSSSSPTGPDLARLGWLCEGAQEPPLRQRWRCPRCAARAPFTPVGGAVDGATSEETDNV